MKKFILAAACIFALGTSLSAQSPAKTDSVMKEATAKCCSGKSKQCDCKAGAACSTPEGAKACEAHHAAVQDSTKSCCKAEGTRRTAKNLALSATLRRHKTPRSQPARVKATTPTAPIRLALYATLRLKTLRSLAVRRSKSLPQIYLF